MTDISPARRLASWLLFSLHARHGVDVVGRIRTNFRFGTFDSRLALINGSLLPPFSEAGWQTVFDTYKTTYPGLTDGMSLGTFEMQFAIEYTHRLLAALVGIVFLVILLRAKKTPDVWRAVKKPLLTAAVLINRASGTRRHGG
jgi:hypothetical protein